MIGGKNNAGKTALLEALLLEHSPQPRSIEQVKELRRESLEAIKAMPERAWDNFFFNQDKNNIIKISSKSNDNIGKTIEIVFVHSITSDILKNLSKQNL